MPTNRVEVRHLESHENSGDSANFRERFELCVCLLHFQPWR